MEFRVEWWCVSVMVMVVVPAMLFYPTRRAITAQHTYSMKFQAQCGRSDRGILVCVYGIDPVLVILQVSWHFMLDICATADPGVIQ